MIEFSFFCFLQMGKEEPNPEVAASIGAEEGALEDDTFLDKYNIGIHVSIIS